MANFMSPPPGWGNDSLTRFIEVAYRNRHATFAIKPEFRRLIKLDECFLRIAQGLINPKDILAPLLLMRSHAAFRAGCEHSAAGQVADTFPQLRACLEYAAYALHMNRNPHLGEAWLKRHENTVAMRSVKNQFTIAKVRTTIQTANRHAARVFDELYQRTIDFGGHPNERSVTGNLNIIEQDDRELFQQVYLHGDGIALDHVLRTTAQTGVCALEILQEVFPERFELLGVRAELLEIRRGL